MGKKKGDQKEDYKKDNGDDKKKVGGEDKNYEKKKEGEGMKGKKRRQLAGHGDHSHDDDDDKKKDMDGKKENMDKKKEEYGDKKDKEPSAELKAAMKACTENKLCKELMECKKKHMESGGKGDGKGDHEHGKGGCADFSEKECEAQKKLPCSWDDGKCAMKKKPTERRLREEGRWQERSAAAS